MSIPSVEKLLYPFLEAIKDGKEYEIRDVLNSLAVSLNLTDEEKNEKDNNGIQTKFEKKAGWAKYYLKKSDFIVVINRKKFCITEKGKKYLSKHSELNFTSVNLNKRRESKNSVESAPSIQEYYINDLQWSHIKKIIMDKHRLTISKSVRVAINGIIWRNRNGAYWRDIPNEFGDWNRIYLYLVEWRRSGAWEEILKIISQN